MWRVANENPTLFFPKYLPKACCDWLMMMMMMSLRWAAQSLLWLIDNDDVTQMSCPKLLLIGWRWRWRHSDEPPKAVCDWLTMMMMSLSDELPKALWLVDDDDDDVIHMTHRFCDWSMIIMTSLRRATQSCLWLGDDYDDDVTQKSHPKLFKIGWWWRHSDEPAKAVCNWLTMTMMTSLIWPTQSFCDWLIMRWRHSEEPPKASVIGWRWWKLFVIGWRWWKLFVIG